MSQARGSVAERGPEVTGAAEAHDHSHERATQEIRFEDITDEHLQQMSNDELTKLVGSLSEATSALHERLNQLDAVQKKVESLLEGATSTESEEDGVAVAAEDDPEAAQNAELGFWQRMSKKKVGRVALAAAGIFGAGFASAWAVFGGDNDAVNGDIDPTPEELRQLMASGELDEMDRDELDRLASGEVPSQTIAEFDDNDEAEVAADDHEVEDSEEAIEDATWEISKFEENERKQWVEGGLEAICDGISGTEMETFEEWLDVIKVDTDAFAKVANETVNPDVDFTAADFEGEGNRVNELAVEQYEEIMRIATEAYEQGNLFYGPANANGWNTGFSNGEVTLAERQGVHGDTRALTLIMEDGSRIDILGRCAQIVIEVPVHEVPVGPTDEDVEPEPTPEEDPEEEPEEDPEEEPEEDPEEEPEEDPEEDPEEEPEEPELDPKDPEEDILENEDLPEQLPGEGSGPLPDEPEELGPPEVEDEDRATDPDSEPPIATDGGSEQGDSNTGTPEDDDTSSGGGDDGVVVQPRPEDGVITNPERDDTPETEHESSQDTSEVDDSTDAAQGGGLEEEDEGDINDGSGSNPF